MGRLHQRFGKSPKEIAALSPKEAANFIMDVITVLEEEGKSGSYISNMTKPVKNWLSFNGVEVQQRIKIAGRGQVTTVADEQTPTQEEMKKILGMTDFSPRWRAPLWHLAGYTVEELDCMGDLSKLTSADINKLVQDKSKRALGLNGNSQKVVSLEEVRAYITEGWEYVRELPPRDAIIKLPD